MTGRERIYRMGVFHHPEERTERCRWSAYTMWLNPAWAGFVGWFEVTATSHREAKRLAIAKAKETVAARIEGGHGLR